MWKNKLTSDDQEFLTFKQNIKRKEVHTKECSSIKKLKKILYWLYLNEIRACHNKKEEMAKEEEVNKEKKAKKVEKDKKVEKSQAMDQKFKDTA